MTDRWPPESLTDLVTNVAWFLSLSMQHFPCSDAAGRRHHVEACIRIDGESYLVLLRPDSGLAWEGRRRLLARALEEGEFGLVGQAVAVVADTALRLLRPRLHDEFGFYPGLDEWFVLLLPDVHLEWLRRWAPEDHRGALQVEPTPRRTDLRDEIRSLLSPPPGPADGADPPDEVT